MHNRPRWTRLAGSSTLPICVLLAASAMLSAPERSLSLLSCHFFAKACGSKLDICAPYRAVKVLHGWDYAGGNQRRQLRIRRDRFASR